jgi:hypothetical protein
MAAWTAPLHLRLDLSEQQQFEGTFEVGSGADDLTLNVDPAGCFVGAGGNFLDPREAANQSAMEANIRRSIDVFEDDDSDGKEDDDDDNDNDDDDDDDISAPYNVHCVAVM